MVTEKILDILYELGTVSSDLIFTDYYTSRKNMYRRMLGVETKEQRARDQAFEALKKERRERQKFLNMLSHLRKSGLIEKKKSEHHKPKWNITERGMKKLQLLRMKQKSQLKPFTPEAIAEDYLKVVIFDIPESEKKKRHWLRVSLLNLNFAMLQKSVWIGKSKLPEEFLFALRDLNIFSYTHIFAINEKGTIDALSILNNKNITRKHFSTE